MSEERLSSTTLYRKHRPGDFEELVGQEAVVEGLSAAVATGRVSHAYLFAGPRGTGKTSAARILARCLDCLTDGPRPDPCGICEACVAIAAGQAFDVVEIDAASNRGIDEIRELRERVRVPPVRLRTKAYIIDEVHMLTPEAFNALLKTLEEPPPHTVFVLATTEPHRVPATIQSRCQRYEFRRLSLPVIVARLREICRREGIDASDGALERIAQLAEGAMRDALVLLEQARGFAGDGAIDRDVLERAFGASHREVIEAIADAVAAGDGAAALRAVAEGVEGGADPAWLTKELVRWFRHALVAQVAPQVLAQELPAAEAEALVRRAAALPRAVVLAALRLLSEASAARYSTQPRFELELALARLIMPADDLSLQSLSERLKTLEERVANASHAGPAAAPTAPNAAPAPRSPGKPPAASFKGASKAASGPDGRGSELSKTILEAMWPRVVAALRDRDRKIAAYAANAWLVDASPSLVTLAVEKQWTKDQLSETPASDAVLAAIAAVSGARPRLVVQIGTRPLGAGAFAAAEAVFGDDLL